MTILELQKIAEACKKCDLSKTRTNVVFADGNPEAKVMLIGEGPGVNEDLEGKPFVGRSGKLMTQMLADVGLVREKNLYIANMVKCRPPENRDPASGEVEACIGYLNEQIQLVSPQIIVCVGRVAAQYMIDSRFKITQQHGVFFQKNNRYYMATIHPASLLRNQLQIPLVEEDFRLLKAKMLELGIQ